MPLRHFAKRYPMNKVRILGGITAIYWALIILVFPISWLIPMVTAALVHELGHYIAVRWFGRRISSIKIGISGARMRTCGLSKGQELICILAGPIFGLFPLLVFRWMPRLAVCALLQSAFNLLPVYPLDGGRILSCAASIVRIPQFFCRIITLLTLMFLLSLSMYCMIALHLGPAPVVLSVILIYKAIKEKDLANSLHIRYNKCEILTSGGRNIDSVD